jgi:hypothetical protein
MTNARRFQLDELVLRPGTYFNPQTEILVVVDDTPEVDHELFETADLDASDWIQISEETPLDEHARDELIDGFQLAHQPGEDHGDDEPPLDEDEEEDEDDEDDDELDGVDDLEFERD